MNKEYFKRRIAAVGYNNLTIEEQTYLRNNYSDDSELEYIVGAGVALIADYVIGNVLDSFNVGDVFGGGGGDFGGGGSSGEW